MDSPIPEGQVKQVVLDRLPRCAVCHSHYEEDDINVVSTKDDVWMMVVECDVCHARNFVAAVMKDGDPNQAKVALQKMSDAARSEDEVTESDPELQREAEASGPPVSAADVVDIHQFLDEFDGDFARLFGDRPDDKR